MLSSESWGRALHIEVALLWGATCSIKSTLNFSHLMIVKLDDHPNDPKMVQLKLGNQSRLSQ